MRDKNRKERFRIFLNEHVHLVKRGGFILSETVDEIYDDALLFTTRQKTALISYDVIEEIHL